MLEEGKNCQYISFKVILTKNLRSKVGPHIATAFAVPEHRDQQDQRDGGDTKTALKGDCICCPGLGTQAHTAAGSSISFHCRKARNKTIYLMPGFASWLGKLSLQRAPPGSGFMSPRGRPGGGMLPPLFVVHSPKADFPGGEPNALGCAGAETNL